MTRPDSHRSPAPLVRARRPLKINTARVKTMSLARAVVVRGGLNPTRRVHITGGARYNPGVRLFASFLGLLLIVLSSSPVLWASVDESDPPQGLTEIEFEDSIEEDESSERDLESDDIDGVDASTVRFTSLDGPTGGLTRANIERDRRGPPLRPPRIC